jgi:selT/selW/selH-like putative selenoprotein
VLEVVPGTGGVFDVHVDGDLVFEKKMLGRYPQPDDVLPRLRAVIGDELLR